MQDFCPVSEKLHRLIIIFKFNLFALNIFFIQNTHAHPISIKLFFLTQLILMD